MGFRLLLDQNVERELAVSLREAGHDVVRVVTEPDLGEGTDDSEILAFAREAERIIVTYDIDFTRSDPKGHAGIFFIPDQYRSVHRITRTIEGIAETLPDSYDVGGVLFITDHWIYVPESGNESTG